MYLVGDLREKALQELRWLALILEQDLQDGDWAATAFAERVRERALESALVIERLAEPPKRGEGGSQELISFFTHRGRIHAQVPTEWMIESPLFAYEDDPHKGAIAMIYFPGPDRAFRLYEDWSGAQAGFAQPVPVVERIPHEGISWNRQPPRIFEPLSKVRLYGGSAQPILLEAVA